MLPYYFYLCQSAYLGKTTFHRSYKLLSKLHTSHHCQAHPNAIQMRFINVFIAFAIISRVIAFTSIRAVSIISYSYRATPINASPSRFFLPDINYGLSDDEFLAWFTKEVASCPGRKKYSSVYDDSINAIVQWRKRYRGNPRLWKRIFKKERVIKELVESAPIIDLVKKAVDASPVGSKKFTIIDLCSGKGYLSMLLSEILPGEKVERCILVDKAWAIASKETTELKRHHMNWDHIYGVNPATGDTYFTTWPISLLTSKQGKHSVRSFDSFFHSNCQ